MLVSPNEESKTDPQYVKSESMTQAGSVEFIGNDKAEELSVTDGFMRVDHDVCVGPDPVIPVNDRSSDKTWSTDSA